MNEALKKECEKKKIIKMIIDLISNENYFKNGNKEILSRKNK